MSSDSRSVSKPVLWTGRILSTLVVLALLASAAGKFAGGQQLNVGFSHLGWPLRYAATLGVLEAGAAILYAIPLTSVLGAILIAGYFGGAMATHLRIGEVPFFFTGFGFGVVAWFGLFLREPRLRKLIPFRR